jgi:hypothetical protein
MAVHGWLAVSVLEWLKSGGGADISRYETGAVQEQLHNQYNMGLCSNTE